jgi:hypothetical protein
MDRWGEFVAVLRPRAGRDARPASECPELCARRRSGDRLRRQNGSAGDGERSRSPRLASATANKDPSTTNSIALAAAATQERAKVFSRPAMPETRPTTVEGWTIREVAGGTVVLDGPSGAWRAAQGDTVPGVGRIDSIVRWGSRWIVATTKGLISTQD